MEDVNESPPPPSGEEPPVVIGERRDARKMGELLKEEHAWYTWWERVFKKRDPERLRESEEKTDRPGGNK